MPPRRANLALLAHLCVSLAVAARVAAATSYSVVDYGAVADGRTDCARAFLGAWNAACADEDEGPVAVVVPAGEYLVSRARFSGPCRSGAVAMDIAGTLLAPTPYAGVQLWIVFQNVDGVSVNGGTLDGRGQAYWACRRAGRGSSCPAATRERAGPRPDVAEQRRHPRDGPGEQRRGDSGHGGVGAGGQPQHGRHPHQAVEQRHHPQRQDGHRRRLHLHSRGLVGRVDPGRQLRPGPRHQASRTVSVGCLLISVYSICSVWCVYVSIGSLGDTPEQVAVRNITVKDVTLAGTTNGLRIKTWAKANSGLVDGVAFSDVVMRNVRNPIIVDQNYCPGNASCPTEGSGIKISNVSYTDVEGTTSATPVAVRFDCSPSQPCTGITMRNVRLSYGMQQRAAESFCRNAHGVAYGEVVPPSCLADQEMLCYK